MSHATRLISAGLLLVAMGGLFSLGAASASEPTVVASVARLLPDELPAAIPHGEIDTPMGEARWVHLSGDITTLPDPLAPSIGPSGLIWFDGGGTRYVSCEGPDGQRRCETDVPPRLWTSDDVISARLEHPLPVNASSADLWLDGDTYWLTTAGPDTLWRSADLMTWEPIDVSGLVSPGPLDLDWDIEIGAPVTSRGATIVPVTYRARDPGRLIGSPGFLVYLEEAGSGRYLVQGHHLSSDGGDVEIGSVLVAETPTGLRLTDEAGATLSELRGVGLDFVEAWAARGSIEEHQLGILDDASVTAVDLPGEPTIDPYKGGPALFPVNDGFLAFQKDADGTVRTWRSKDGRSWAEGDRVRGPDGALLEAEDVGASSAWGEHEAEIRTVDPDGDGRSDRWLSSDGETWTLGDPWPPETGEEGLVYAVLPGGTLRLADDGSWAASLDGTTWVDVPELREVVTKWTPGGNGPGSASVGSNGNALILIVKEFEGRQQRDLWIIEFKPTPS